MAANRSSRRLPNELFWETAKWARLEHYERNLLENGAARLLVGAAFGVYLRQHCHKLKASASNNKIIQPTMRVKCRHCNASIDINDYLNHFNECGAPQAFFNANFTLDPTIYPPLDSTGEGTTSNAALRERGAETESGTNATAPTETAPSSVSTIHNMNVIDDVMQDPFIAGVVSSNIAHFDGVNLALVPIVPPSTDSLDEATSTAALSRKRGAEAGTGAGVSGSPPNKQNKEESIATSPSTESAPLSIPTAQSSSSASSQSSSSASSNASNVQPGSVYSDSSTIPYCVEDENDDQ